MLHAPMRRTYKWLLPLTALLAAPLLSCTGSSTSITGSTLSDLMDLAKSAALNVRVVNGTTADLEVTVRLDGEETILPICTALQRSCDYIMTSCPNRIELVQEIHRDANKNIVGGHNFDGLADYAFEKGDYDCGGQIIYEINDTTASAMAF